MILTRPWLKPEPISSPYEKLLSPGGTYRADYERRERKIVWFRYYPYSVFIFFFQTAVAMATCLSLNFSSTSMFGGVMYMVTFRWLTGLIIDIYFGKFLVYLFSVPFRSRSSHAVKPPVLPSEITDEQSCMMLNPLRPADDNQLRNVVRKSVDSLTAIPSDNFISVLILQAVGNSYATFSKYESILREEIFDR